MPSSAGKKKDGSGDTVEFASGSFLVVPGGSTGGVLLVSGANVTMFNGSGTPDLNVEAGTLSFSSTWTGGKLTLGGGSFGGSGALTVSGFNWTGGTLGDGGGSLTSSAATISGTADHYMQGGYTWTANGTTTWSGGRLHGLVPTSLAAGNDFQLTSTGTFNIRTDSDFIADPVSDGKQHVFFQSSGTLDKTDTGIPGQTEIEVPFLNTGSAKATNATLTLSGGDGTSHYSFPSYGSFTTMAAGVLEFAGGSFSASTVTNNGTLKMTAGSLHDFGAFSNPAKVVLNGGTFTVAGFTQTSAGEIDANISSAGTGKIVSTASVSLAGTLNAANATSFTPTAGTVYTVLQGTSVTGTCAGSIGTYTLGVGATTVTLTA